MGRRSRSCSAGTRRCVRRSRPHSQASIPALSRPRTGARSPRCAPRWPADWRRMRTTRSPATLPTHAPPDCDYDAAAIARGDSAYERLERRIYACYTRAVQRVQFEGKTLDRLTAHRHARADGRSRAAASPLPGDRYDLAEHERRRWRAEPVPRVREAERRALAHSRLARGCRGARAAHRSRADGALARVACSRRGA